MAPAGESPATTVRTGGQRTTTSKAAPASRIAGAATQSETPEQRADRRFAECLARPISKHHGRVVLSIFAENSDRHTVAARRELVRTLHAIGWSSSRIGKAIGRHPRTVRDLLVDRKPGRKGRR